jgi:hypothetical protein
MYLIENFVGRLIEVRVETPVAPEELEAFGRRLRAVLAPHAFPVAFCVDLRGARLFPPEVSDGFVALMRADNPRLDRSAFLVSESALFSLQVERMIREAGSPKRRTFREAAELSTWLGETLSPEEKARLVAYLSSSPPPA